MFKWTPHKEQYTCERRLIKVMKRLKIEDFNFNWDRSSCCIEFHYQGSSYKMEHSLEQAKKQGIVMLRNGLDCLFQLVQSLEDLSQIIERGTYKLDIWISNMKQTTVEEETTQYSEEVHIRYKSIEKPTYPEFNRGDEFVLAAPESSLGEYDQNEFTQRSKRK
ncbi:hypothetical protein [Salipaludibacillus sp. CF4.18]|uniref:hypothetical protein n=1 Tax=Salipaludibacillus sp. CF4.18 TaxID=3373081 RepID=UPI003EE7904D